MRKPYRSETLDRFMVRLPDGMRDTLKSIADANKRTMNAEIVARLERTIAEDTKGGAEALKALQASPTIRLERQMSKDRADLEQQIADLAEEVAAIKAKLDTEPDR